MMQDHGLLAIATGAFIGTHFLLSHPLRQRLVARFGEQGFLGIYSLVAFATFIPMVWFARSAPVEPLYWSGGIGVWHGANLSMWIASVLLFGSMKGNPAMPSPDGPPKMPDQARGVFAITRHPMMWAFAIWAATHIALVGSLQNIIVAGGLGFLALAGAAGQDAKKARLMGEAWKGWQARTAFIPFIGQLTGRISWAAAWPGWRAVIGGTVLLFIATGIHPLLGGPVVGPWIWIGG